jgi:dTDP-4-dehydrorhamnose reductase
VRVLVTGAAGQVGQDLQDVLEGVIPAGGAGTSLLDGLPVRGGEFEVVACDHSRLDVTDRIQVAGLVDQIRPEAIVHLAAYTAVDRAESEPELAWAVNVESTRSLAEAAEHCAAQLIYISSDYVFPGDLGRPLVESDPTGPLSVYGRTKLEGERVCPPTATIVRTSWVAGLRGKNLFHLAVAAAREGRALRFVDDQVGTPTSAADLAAGLVAFLRERRPGVFHVAGTGQASWFEAIRFAVEVAGGSPEQVSPIRTEELDPRPAATRPAFSPLTSERLGPEGLSGLPDWHEGIERLVQAIADQAEQAGRAS